MQRNGKVKWGSVEGNGEGDGGGWEREEGKRTPQVGTASRADV
jgi:hypothetical protein